MKFSVNSPCPCGSNIKYKKCCGVYHKGALPKTALLLMKSRYSAFVVNDAKYIMKTTHPNNLDFTDDTAAWKKSIEAFSGKTDFLGLEILETDLHENSEGNVSHVTFCAHLSSGDLIEKSRFEFLNGRWLYESGEFQ
jgi:SEC-C motif-containing protein